MEKENISQILMIDLIFEKRFYILKLQACKELSIGELNGFQP